jgi:uncharacterized protein YcbK (DUF882 family)
MTREEWAKITHFKPDSKVDQWGNPDKLDFELIQRLDAFRTYIGLPVLVTSGYRPGGGSQHGLGKAVDFVVPQWAGGLLDLYFEVERFNFNGLGIYRDWIYQGKHIYGIHIDMRDIKDRRSARWLCIRPKAEEAHTPGEVLLIKQEYLALSAETLYDTHIV